MTSFRTRIIAIAGAAAIAGISAAVLMSAPSFTQAQTPTPVVPAKPGGPGNQLTVPRGPMKPEPAQMEQQRQLFLSRLAARLNTTPDALTSAFKQTRKDMVADMVKQGKITQEQADKMNARIDQGGIGGMHGPNAPKGQGGQRAGGGQQLRALQGILPAALGMSQQDFRTAMQGGKTPMQIATEKGLSRDAFKAAINTQLEQRLTQAKQQGTLTDQQIAEIRARAQQMIDRMIDNAGHRAGPGQGQPKPKPAGQ